MAQETRLANCNSKHFSNRAFWLFSLVRDKWNCCTFFDDFGRDSPAFLNSTELM